MILAFALTVFSMISSQLSKCQLCLSSLTQIENLSQLQKSQIKISSLDRKVKLNFFERDYKYSK